MELSVREWMIIIGVLLIVAVLLDGYRRVRSERSNRIRVTLTRQALGRAHNPLETAEPPKEPNPELPNGGARVIPKQRREDLNLDQPAPVLMESVHIAPALAEPEVFATDVPCDSRADAIAAAVTIELPVPEALAEEKIEPHFVEQFDEPPVAADEPVLIQPEAGLVELDDELEIREPYAAVQPRSFHDAGADQSRPNSCAQEVLIVNVISKDKAGFKGQDLLQILLACDMRFGNMNIFHRYEKANGKGLVQFSVANLVEPGTFDLDRIESFSTPGLCFFLTLPGPEKPVTAFNYMVETAQVLVKNLQGELRDEAHSVMTQQTIEHYRQRIRDFERKQLTLHL